MQLFEFEDQTWFPSWIRILMTRYIISFHRLFKTSDLLIGLIQKGLFYSTQPIIVDLCSGSGGPMLDVYENLKTNPEFSNLQLYLSDLYPDTKATKAINSSSDTNLHYIEESTDATSPNLPKGLRTMISSLHHMPPNIAKQILAQAKNERQPILIFEISDNGAPKLLWWLALPFAFLAVFFVTPRIRPLTWQQLVFTYLIPILPLFIAWDGAVSNARTYTIDDLDILLENLYTGHYNWEKGKIKGRGGNKIYLLGKPTV